MPSSFIERPAVALDVIALDFAGCTYQTLVINLPQPGILIPPSVLCHLKLPADLDLSHEVVLFGQAPTWLYCYLIEQCRQAPWIGCYNAPMGKVVVIHSQSPQFSIGDVIAPAFNHQPGIALLVGGPPDSGKSLLATALRRAVAQSHPQCRLFLNRANWDGQGNWTYESHDSALTDRLVLGFDAKLHWHPEAATLVPQYFKDQAETVQNLRKVRDLVLVDVGGVPQPEKHPVVQACSHYIVISREPEAIASWHSLCAPTLPCLAVFHSEPDGGSALLSQSPPLEFSLGLRSLAETGVLPELLLTAISQLLQEST
ncbi:MAG: CRISPR-associated ring nuclease Crn3/Csx3 [Stenomitos frigidus ULC029]